MGKNECSNLSLSGSVRDKGNLSSNSVLYIMELHKHEILKKNISSYRRGFYMLKAKLYL